MKKNSRQASDIVTIVFWSLASAVLLVVIWMNLEPWFALGADFTAMINKNLLIRLADWLVGGKAGKVLAFVFFFITFQQCKKKPWLAVWAAMCGLVLLLNPNTLISAIAELVGFIFWSWIQVVQAAPLICKHSIAGTNREWLKELRNYRIAAYLIEAIACFIKYPPYAGGDFSRLLSDLTNGFFLDPGLWSWPNFFWAIATMAAVELTIHFLLKAAVAVRVTRVTGAAAS